MVHKQKGRLKMRRSGRQREENQIIEAIKWWQNQVFKGMVIVLLPLFLIYAGFVWWIGTPAGEEYMGWAEQDRQDERVLESMEKDRQKQLDEFTESTNEDVQNTVDEIQGTQDTTGTEQYSEEVQNTINELEQ